MENDLTPKIKEWLDTEPQRRDLLKGAMLLLMASRNRILYNNIVRRPQKHAQALEYHLNKIYIQRLKEITHHQVSEMMQKVEKISTSHGIVPKAERSEWQKGKRADHDELPEEIQRLYVENADILRRMRDAHTRLRLISPETSSCPDNDRYPLAKYIIELDHKYRDNWNLYDHFIKGQPTEMAVDPRTVSRNAAKLCILLLGQYRLSPSVELADRIKKAFGKVVSPSQNLIAKMKDAKLMP